MVEDDSEPLEIKSIEDIALLDEHNGIRIVVNDSEKFVAKDWLHGSGRASGSILAKQILGTEEGLSGTTNLTVDPELESAFDLLILWMALGSDHLKSSLTEENASDLFALASYFGLEQLVEAIEKEKQRRDEEARKEEERQRRERVARERREQERLDREMQERRKRASGMVRCANCSNWTTVARSYLGNSPRCADCRDRVYDDDYDIDPYDQYEEYDEYDRYGDSEEFDYY